MTSSRRRARGIPPRAIALAVFLLPGGAAAQARPPAPIMELPALLDLFLLPAGSPDASIIGWDAGTEPTSRIRWPIAGITPAPPYLEQEGFPYHRVGLVDISVDGQPAYQVTQELELRCRDRPPGGDLRTLLAGPGEQGGVHNPLKGRRRPGARRAQRPGTR